MSKRRQGEEAQLNDIAAGIRDGIRRVKELNESGDYSTVMTWVIPGKLACAARPLRYHHVYGGSGKSLPLEAKRALDEWIENVRSKGIVSVICLASEKELAHYSTLLSPGMNLVDYYAMCGMEVRHIPWADPAQGGYWTFQEEVKAKRSSVLAAYDELPKPCLIHCSAAIDRSPPVVAYVVLRRNGSSDGDANTMEH